MILVSVGRNSGPFLQGWRDSIMGQTYLPEQVLVIDDGSTDDSPEILSELDFYGKVILREPEDRRWGLYNKSVAILEEMDPEDDDVIVSLDLDDFLLTTCALERIAKIFEDPEVWLSYGGITPMQGIWDGRKVAGPMDWNRPPRKQKWRATSLRAWRWFLMKNILKKDLQDGRKGWLKFPEDRITMYPMLEMAGSDHVHCYDGPAIYGYRDNNPENDFRVNAEPISKALARILRASPYPIRTERSLRNHACDWI